MKNLISKNLISNLETKASEIRKTVLEMCINAETGHLTSTMSCIEILVALYNIMKVDPKNPSWDGRDRFILSKGQASPGLYAILADMNFFDKKELEKWSKKDGKFGVHLQRDVEGVEITAGSLGHGFNMAVGIALGFKKNNDLNLTFVLLGDGECYEGSIWEAALLASHHRLNNLIAIIDRNYMCATDFTENLLELEPLDDKWISFGWDVKHIDGHSFEAILDVLCNVRSRRSGKPLIIIADTVKGKGIESICNIPLMHANAPKGHAIERCRSDLNRYCNKDDTFCLY